MYDSNCKEFWKRSFRDSKNVSDCLGFKGRESKMSTQSTGDIRAGKLFCMIVYTSLYICQNPQNTQNQE